MAEDSSDLTHTSDTAGGFGRPPTGLSLIAVLTPVSQTSVIPQTRIDGTELVIGCGAPAEGVDLQVIDDRVSRRHTRITRIGNQFLIEDLNSSNGTFLDGVPISASVLHDGDMIQIGRSLVYFDHLYVFEDEAHSEETQATAPSRMSMRDWYARRTPLADSQAMSIRFWGTRGSLPTPGAETRKYGGNTTCVELRYGNTIIALDAGSGIRGMSQAWMDEFVEEPISASLCLTHLHWDHIQGFPFFGAAYQPKNTIRIFGARRESGTTMQMLGAQMQGDYFPIPLSAMKASIQFLETQRRFQIDEIDVETFDLPHPSGSLGYRFTAGGSVFVLATDSELDQVAVNWETIKDDFRARREYEAEFLHHFRDADLLLIDCQYADDEYLPKRGWGHNSIAAVVDLCAQVRPKMVALSHHDPKSNDQIVGQYVKDANARLRALGIDDILVFGGREQLSIVVQSPKRPYEIDSDRES